MYSELLSSSKPGLIIILIDQSSSMSDSYGGSTKAKFAALAVNRVIAEIIAACTNGDEIKDRCYVAAIGYGANVNVLFLEKASELAKNPNEMTIGNEIVRVFVNPISSGGTPMAEAFQTAYKGAEKFIANNPQSFPPIVINITDGEPNDFNSTITEAKKLAQLKTTDGNVLILNAHISTSAGMVELPNSNAAFGGDKFAKLLFDMSSVLPDNVATKAKDAGFTVQPSARGFVFNADGQTLVKILNFGSLGAAGGLR